MVLRALLFDFDGLILDTEMPELVSWQELWAEHGQNFPVERYVAQIGTVGGYGALGALEELTGPLDRASVLARRSARKLALIEIEQLRPGVLDYLEQAGARGTATAVVSSSSRGWVDSHLERLGLAERFELVVTGDHDPVRGKPSPTLYLEALAGLGVAAAEAIALEDSPNGIRAAKAAGIFCIAVPNAITATLDLAQADLVVESLAALPFERLPDLLSG